MNPDAEVRVLDRDTFRYFVSVPGEPVRRLAGNPTHFSDILRVLLLSRYGGVWADATCWVTEPLTTVVPSLLQGGFFAFNYSGPVVSNWFLASDPGGYTVSTWAAAMLLYWQAHHRVAGYFMHHHLFESLFYQDEQFRASWLAGVRKGSRPPHALQGQMFSAVADVNLSGLPHRRSCTSSSTSTTPGTVSADSVLAHLVRSGI